MKRTLLAIALSGLAAAAFAAEDVYRTNAGESEQDNFVQIQLGDAGDVYRTNAGEADSFGQIQLGDAGDAYRNDAGESTQDDVVQTQLG